MAGRALGCLVLVGLVTFPARADRIRLRGGGEIRGIIVAGDAPEGKVLIQTETGSKPLTIDRDRIESVVTEDDPLDAYYARRDKVPATAEEQYQFGLWCESQKLSGLAKEHYRQATELDPDHAGAQKKLGRVQHEGVWMTVAEQRRAQGLVLHKGRWISRETFDRLEKRQAVSDENTARARELQVLKQALDTGDPRTRDEAEQRLADFAEPAAVPALVQVFGNDVPTHRTRLMRLLGSIPGEASRDALIERLLVEHDPAVRRAGLDELERRDEPEMVLSIIRRLTPKNPNLSGRVARLLADLGAVEAVPRLIPLLGRIERRPIIVNSTTYVPPQGISVVTGETIPVLTGPVVGNGVAAYGAVGVPYLSGVALGNPGTMQSSPALKLLTIHHKNADVLAALESLTGQSFGYDQTAWRRWWSRTRGPEEPVKRVRQP